MLQEAFAELVAALGDQVFEVTLPEIFEAASAERQTINSAEMAYHYYRYWRDGADSLGPETRAFIGEGNATAARDYLAARDLPKVLNAALEEIFSRCDAILCPAATGPAPSGLASTGNPIFNGLWTFCGTPCVTLPILVDANGMPMGVQLVAAHGNDARLLRTAQWLHDWASGEDTTRKETQ